MPADRSPLAAQPGRGSGPQHLPLGRPCLQVKSVVDSLPSDLPTKPCCDAVEKASLLCCTLALHCCGKQPHTARSHSHQPRMPASPAAPPRPCRAQFDAAGCGCEASLSSTLKAVGLESSPQGLQGGELQRSWLRLGSCGARLCLYCFLGTSTSRACQRCRPAASWCPAVTRIAATACDFEAFKCD